VTRDSILQLARKWDEFKVSERAYTMTDIKDAVREGFYYAIYLLYQFTSTNTDTDGRQGLCARSSVRAIYLLYSYKTTITDAEG
jgi:hypothetical protein